MKNKFFSFLSSQSFRHGTLRGVEGSLSFEEVPQCSEAETLRGVKLAVDINISTKTLQKTKSPFDDL